MSNEQAQEFLNQATQSVQSGQFDQALTLVDQCLALDPSNGDAYLLRGIALSQTKQPDLAQAAFRAAADLMPGSPKPLFNLAVHLYGTGYKREAYDAANEALQLDPSHAQARDLASRLQQELGIPAPGIPTAGPEGPQAQNPYAQGANYYRPGYENQTGQVHSIAFVERMGANWDKIGLIICGVSMLLLLLGLGNLMSQWDAIMTSFRGGTPYQQPSTPLSVIQNILGWVTSLSALFWVISDIADRRGSWLWLVGFILCCCCAPFQFVYYYFTRKGSRA
ncbi:MAG: tetratricopeptide repeat protein [Fimbriimonadaceae bacterium]